MELELTPQIVGHRHDTNRLGGESQARVARADHGRFGNLAVRDGHAAAKVIDAGDLTRLPRVNQHARDVVRVHIITADIAFEQLDETTLSQELEKARRNARVVRLVHLAGAEDVEESEADDLRLPLIQMGLDPAVEEQLRVAVCIEWLLARRIIGPAHTAVAVEGGGRSIDYRDAAELDPLTRVLEVVAQHPRRVGLEDISPGSDVEDDVECRKPPVECLDVELVEREII